MDKQTRLFECAARRQGTAGGNDPADCDWPSCGCDQMGFPTTSTNPNRYWNYISIATAGVASFLLWAMAASMAKVYFEGYYSTSAGSFEFALAPIILYFLSVEVIIALVVSYVFIMLATSDLDK